MNFAAGWCAVTALGRFDHRKGGQLVFDELQLIIDIPSGATIFFPSALMTHYNLAIGAEEERFSMVRYTAGGLFMFAAAGFRTLKKLRADGETGWKTFREQVAEREVQFVKLFPTETELEAAYKEMCI